MAKYGVLLTNIGTPSSPSRPDVARYLREFLMDPHVIRLPWPLRALLVQGVIVPFRAARSAALYEKVWMPEGSPLLVHSLEFAKKLQEQLGGDWLVELGMRYGAPSFETAMAQLQAAGVEKLVLFPLFPQYALSSTQTSLDHAARFVQSAKLPVQKVEAFYDDAGFVDAWVEQFREMAPKKFEHVIMSFHGLPTAHLTALSADCAKCPKDKSCYPEVEANPSQKNCYRRQSLRTAELIAGRLGLRMDQYTVSFQSRLGVNEWILPNTVNVVDELCRQGVKRLVVMCPSFVADCLETVEEVHIQLRERFLTGGGEEFTVISCLNAHPRWVRAAQELICKNV